MRRAALLRMTRISLFAALLCVLAPFSLPLGAVPVSLGLLAVFLCGILLPPQESLAAVAVYLGLGALGLPVFSGFSGGFGVLLGPLGGYLWSYLAVAPMTGVSVGKCGMLRWLLFVFLLLPLFICYLFGSLQYAFVAEIEVTAALYICVLPFLPFDILKLVFAVRIAARLKRISSENSTSGLFFRLTPHAGRGTMNKSMMTTSDMDEGGKK